MFCRNSDREGGKIEILLHLALGLEGFSQFLKVPRIIDGERMSVTVANKSLYVDRTQFETSFEKIVNNMSNPNAQWNDNIILPSFEDGLIKTKRVLLELVSASSYDEDALFNLENVMLCGGHCQGCPIYPPGFEIAKNMAKIMAVGGAMRGAAQTLSKSIRTLSLVA